MTAQPRRRFWVVVWALSALLVGSIILSLGIGAVMKPPAEIVREAIDGSPLIWRYRMPRVLVGMLAGAGMAVSGSVLQTALRNPLAAPGTVGITAGGGLAAVAALLAVGSLPAAYLTPIAFVGSLCSSLLVFLLCWGRVTDPLRLTLTGVAVSVGLGALTQLLLVKAAPEAGAAMAWLKGSLYARTMSDAQVIGPVIVIVIGLAVVLAHHLDTLQLDSMSMAGIGASEAVWRIVAVGIAIVLGSASVAAAGVLGFVGLIIPHAARMLVGAPALRAIPVTVLAGASVVTLCDALGRWLFAPTEIPVGALIAVIGSPYFVVLLLRVTSRGTVAR